MVLHAPPNYVLNYLRRKSGCRKSVVERYGSRHFAGIRGSKSCFCHKVFRIYQRRYCNVNYSACSITIRNNQFTGWSYPIVLSGGSAANYTMQNTNAVLTISKANLTATADNQTRVYGDPNPAFTITYSGFLNADGPSKITAPVVSTTATVLSPVGFYPITLSGGSALNYQFLHLSRLLLITPAALTVKADDRYQ